MRDRVSAIVVIILAGTLAFVVVCYSLYALIYKATLQPPASTTLASAVGGMLGIIGAYVGGRSQRSDPSPPPERQRQ